MNDKEIWIRAYCAAIESLTSACIQDDIAAYEKDSRAAAVIANLAVERFKERWDEPIEW